MTSNPLTIDARLPSAAANAPDAPSPGVRPRRAAANRDRRSVSGNDRVARRLRERLLFARYRGRHDLAARDELAERFLPLATQLAQRYRHSAEPLEDLVQVASVGLLKAIDRFDPERGTAFSSFAVPTILGELKRHFRDKGWAVKVPRDLQELAAKVDRVGEEIGRELGRAPTPSELGERAGATPEQVLEAREAAAAYRAVSLDRPRNEDDEEGALVDAFGSEDHGFAVAEDAATVQRLMRVLPEREREVLRLRFEKDLTQSEIGDIVGVSQMHVSRLLRKALTRLRETAQPNENPAATQSTSPSRAQRRI